MTIRRRFLASFCLVSVCSAAVLGSCAVTPRPVPDEVLAAPRVSPADIDWDAAGDEAVRVLADYLRVDTVNPPGNETAGAIYLASILEKEGVETEILEFAPGRGSLLARVRGSGKKPPLCLLSHIDVASAEAHEWPEGKGPLSGAVDDGYVWGRGALDMKGLGALETLVVAWLARTRTPLDRDVVLLAVADEEVANGGMRHVVEKHWDRIGCSHVINEGGLGLRGVLFEGQTVFAVSTGEKGLVWTRMIASGATGHGSTPVPGRAPERLLNALDKIRRQKPAPNIAPSVLALLREAGEGRGGTPGYVLARPALIDLLVMDDLLGNPATRATITNTCQVTGFAGQLEPNVVPSEVSATLDCRLLPGMTPAMLLAELKALVDDENVRFEALHVAEANESPWDDELFHSIARHAKAGRSDVVVGPVLSPGFTDSLFLRPMGVRAYGFVPFEITPEEAATMHGKDERVSVENVHRGLKMLFDVVYEVSAAK